MSGPFVKRVRKQFRSGRARFHRPGGMGYTDDLARAGLFDASEVIDNPTQNYKPMTLLEAQDEMEAELAEVFGRGHVIPVRLRAEDLGAMFIGPGWRGMADAGLLEDLHEEMVLFGRDALGAMCTHATKKPFPRAVPQERMLLCAKAIARSMRLHFGERSRDEKLESAISVSAINHFGLVRLLGELP